MKKINIEDLFKYHPPTTESRVKNHESVNLAALEFAKTIESLDLENSFVSKIMDHIQMARMFANQAITLKDINGNNSKKL